MRVLVHILFAALVLAWTGAPAFAEGKLPADLQGKFRGQIVGSDGKSSGDFNLVISKSRGGFTVQWPTRTEATFESAGRPGVFRNASKATPLEGDPVYWARVADGALVVYAAQIDKHGGYHIRNYHYVPVADGVEVVLTQIAAGGEPAVSKGRLMRYGK